MTSQPSYESFPEYKARREELIRAIDYNNLQTSYHKSQVLYLEEELKILDSQHQTNKDKLTEAKSLENKLSIQEVADFLAMDKKTVEDRVQKRKADALLTQMMKGFK